MAVKREELRHARERCRCLRFLQKGVAWLQPGAKEASVLLDGGERGTISILLDVLKALEKDDLVSVREDQVALTAAGIACARRLAAKQEPFASQHREIERRVLHQAAQKRFITASLSESPLAQLANRRMRNGKPFLTRAEFDAGERLRTDYTRGQIMPRLSASWMASVSGKKHGSGAGGGVELTQAALASRQRVDRALVAVGPELAGVLVDICCFLKGFEQVEMERGWPVRSAKVVLKTALGVLARHYEPPPRRESGTARSILHWGAQDYRPKLA
ncbi:DUF6456 domain-containing protein [Nitratireductor kimnyeongensis]|uniref:DUF6456 domain-containing protein n=1 Tax=Nitratireductor kimnyeongensis TaxID=430679 RepID=A0ABW0T519_9HYPH|nr:DUF6456 domain-containing protein [Nitratireductor kimnyeongensis]QZZ34992.1 hypothetical protein KW403_14575 [Nitratireductor kimnyeongensis]